MNLGYHLIIGVAGELLVPESRGRFFLTSIAPDLTLLFNELKIRFLRQPFSADRVDAISFVAYHLVHSLWVTIMLFLISPLLGTAHLIHIVADWFTHTGRFAAMPLYPIIRWRIPFGREILK